MKILFDVPDSPVTPPICLTLLSDAATFAALQPPTNFFVMMMGLSKAISNASADVILPTLPPPKNEPMRARLFTSPAL